MWLSPGHTRNTKVGDDFVRGVSGGERKRVSIAEMALAGPPIAAWDNSTRGLDSQTALEFVRSLRIAADVAGLTSLIAICKSGVFPRAASYARARRSATVVSHTPSDLLQTKHPKLSMTCAIKQSSCMKASKSTSAPQTKRRRILRIWAGIARRDKRPEIS